MILQTVKYKNTLKNLTLASQLSSNIIRVRVEKIFSLNRRKNGLLIGIFLIILSLMSLLSFSTEHDAYENKSDIISSNSFSDTYNRDERINLYRKHQQEQLQKLEFNKGVIQLNESEKEEIISSLLDKEEKRFKEEYKEDIKSIKREANHLQIEIKSGEIIGASVDENKIFKDYSLE